MSYLDLDLLKINPYIFTSFPSFRKSPPLLQPGTDGPIDLNFGIWIARCEVYLSMYIAYISVSKPTPWAVSSPHGPPYQRKSQHIDLINW